MTHQYLKNHLGRQKRVGHGFPLKIKPAIAVNANKPLVLISIMKLLILIFFIFTQHLAISQWVHDSTYLKNFDKFVRLTDKLITLTNIGSDSTINRQHLKHKSDSSELLANQIVLILLNLDSIDKFSFDMPNYFIKGKWPKSQDHSSPTAQLQCSYLYYMEDVRKAAGNTQNVIKACLILENYRLNGFPASKYCPFYYDPVEILFNKPPPKKIIIPDSIKNNY